MCKASATPSAIIYDCAFGAGGGRSGRFTGAPGGGPFGGGPFGGGPFGGALLVGALLVGVILVLPEAALIKSTYFLVNLKAECRAMPHRRAAGKPKAKSRRKRNNRHTQAVFGIPFADPNDAEELFDSGSESPRMPPRAPTTKACEPWPKRAVSRTNSGYNISEHKCVAQQ